MTNSNERPAQSVNEQMIERMNEFSFSQNKRPIRVVEINGKTWFVARDVASNLNIHWKGDTLAQIPDEWSCMTNLVIQGQRRSVRLINEPAIYKLAFRSNSGKADKFTNWVASEVLPSIRKTGSYSVCAKEMYGVKPIVFEGQALYPYTFALLSLGYSKRSGQVAKRKKLYPSGFVKLMNRNFITPKFFELLHSMSQVRQLSMEFSNKALELKGGR